MQSSSWIEYIPGRDRMLLQSRAFPAQNRFLEQRECCRAEQFLDGMDSWNRQDAAVKQSRSLIQWIPVKDGTLKSRVIPGWYIFLENTGFCRTEQFLENTGCCRAEQFLDRRDSWKIRDAAEQSSSWIEQIPGIDGMLQSRAVPRWNIFLKQKGRCRAEQILDRIDSWKRRDAAAEQSSQHWIEQISEKDRMLQSRAVQIDRQIDSSNR